MKILCYNIQAGCGGNSSHLAIWNYFRAKPETLNRISNHIASMEPDIIGLIEVDAGSFRSQNQAEYLAGKLCYRYASACKYGWAAGLPVLKHQHLAILSKYPILKIREHKFSKGFKRLVLEVELQTENGTISALVTHLSLISYTRKKQLEELSSIINKTNGKIILLGDFNQEDLKIPGLKSCCSDKTFPSWNPEKHIDYIFINSGKVKSAFAPAWRLSDHLPVCADVEI